MMHKPVEHPCLLLHPAMHWVDHNVGVRRVILVQVDVQHPLEIY
jgi:hypothetical protein